MKRDFETKFGTITLQNVMVDIDGTNLEEGIDISLNDELIGTAYGDGTDFDFDNDEYVTIEMVEDYVVEFADIDKL